MQYRVQQWHVATFRRKLLVTSTGLMIGCKWAEEVHVSVMWGGFGGVLPIRAMGGVKTGRRCPAQDAGTRAEQRPGNMETSEGYSKVL